MRRIYQYLNPIEYLGDTAYSFLFPFIITSVSAIILEFYAYQIVHNPQVVAPFALFLFITYII